MAKIENIGDKFRPIRRAGDSLYIVLTNQFRAIGIDTKLFLKRGMKSSEIPLHTVVVKVIDKKIIIEDMKTQM